MKLSNIVVGLNIKSQDITRFLDGLRCSNGGKHAYYRALRAFYNWLYSPKSGYRLNPAQNPILVVDAPKVERRILPSLSIRQVQYLIERAECSRDKAIISLFADSGLRLSELVGIKVKDIDWQNRLIKVWCKGNKEGLAPFGKRTEAMLKQWLSSWHGSKLWDIDYWGIVSMLKRLQAMTELPVMLTYFAELWLQS